MASNRQDTDIQMMMKHGPFDSGGGGGRYSIERQQQKIQTGWFRVYHLDNNDNGNNAESFLWKPANNSHTHCLRRCLDCFQETLVLVERMASGSTRTSSPPSSTGGFISPCTSSVPYFSLWYLALTETGHNTSKQKPKYLCRYLMIIMKQCAIKKT